MGGNVANKVNNGYAAKDGILYCTATDGGDLFLDKEYRDFDFRFEFKLTKAANNGVGIRAPARGDSAYTGMEIQVLDDDDPAYKDLRAVQYCGSIYDVVAAKRGHLKPVGEWNSEEIKAVGPHVTIRLNARPSSMRIWIKSKTPTSCVSMADCIANREESDSSGTGAGLIFGICGSKICRKRVKNIDPSGKTARAWINLRSSCLLPASARFGGPKNKLFEEIAGITVFRRASMHFSCART